MWYQKKFHQWYSNGCDIFCHILNKCIGYSSQRSLISSRMTLFLFDIGFWYGTKLIWEENYTTGNVFTVSWTWIFSDSTRRNLIEGVRDNQLRHDVFGKSHSSLPSYSWCSSSCLCSLENHLRSKRDSLSQLYRLFLLTFNCSHLSFMRIPIEVLSKITSSVIFNFAMFISVTHHVLIFPF